MVVACPECASDDLVLVERRADERRLIRCESCHHEWLRGEARRPPVRTPTIDDLRRRLHAHGDLRPEVARSVDSLKSRYLHMRPEPPPHAVDFREHYRRIFSADGLPGASADDLKYFANANTGGNPGNMSVFNTAWNEMGADTAAERVRETIGYLLHGPDAVALEDRLTQLIDGRGNVGMPGFKEALLTKALCMVEPTRFLPINKYDGQAGKRQIAKWVFDLDLPAPESVSWTIGRLIVWSNDLLLALVGDGFVDADHIAGFLWWAKDAAGQEP